MEVALLLFGLTLLYPTIARSTDCPAGAPDNGSIGWTFGGCYTTTLTINGGGGTYTCQVEICWCYRYISATNYFDYKLSSVRILPGTCADVFDHTAMVNYITTATENLYNTDPGHDLYVSYIPPCNEGMGSSLVTRVVKASCWSYTTIPGGGILINPCSGGGWCVKGKYICMDGSTEHVISTFTTEYAGTCANGCDHIQCM
jgi:hypothetical protein